MNRMPFSRRIQNMMAESARTIAYITDPRLEELRKDPQMSDFLLGNPHELPLPGITQSLQRWAVPQNKEWFAYKMSEPRSREIIAGSLQRSHRLAFEPEDIFMTTGAFAGLAAVISLITDPGDEIVYISPPWFFYSMMIAANDGTAVRVPCDKDTFDLDLDAIRSAITARTRGIIINSPNNPTGRIYPENTLRQLAELLASASAKNGRTIYLLSDEAYRRIVYDGNPYYSPAAYYPNTFVIYTYGKTLLAPGQRLGYVALPPDMPEREMLRMGLMASLVASGFTFPNALLQHALEDLERLSIDIDRLQRRRDRLSAELARMGYELQKPEGTFYLLVRSPLEDEMQFVEMLIENKVLCLPGTMFEMPGYFRVSLTANDDMVERSIAGFQSALEAARAAVQRSPSG